MTPAQPEAQAPYRTLAWCAVAHGASDAERDQSRALRMRGKRGPQTGDDPRDPRRSGVPTACCRVPWHTHWERCTTGPVGRGLAQRGTRASGERLLRNQKMRSYRIHTASETKTVTIEPGREDTVIMHMGSGPGELQGDGPAKQSHLRMAAKNRQEKNA